MGLRPFNGIAGFLLAGLAAIGLGTARALSSAPMDVLDGPIAEVLGRQGGSVRSYGSTPGGRAHRRWKTARSSGRHDFRRTLRKAA